MNAMIDSIRALAHTIHAETGRYVVYSEHMHKGCLAVTVSVQIGDNEFDWFRGSKNPLDGYETTIEQVRDDLDRKSTRLNSSHVRISYAVFCLKKKI